MRTPATFHLWSSIGKKLLTGLPGLLLILFIIMHLAGNLTILAGKDTFNGYAHRLEAFGPVLLVLEIAIVALFAVHAVIGINVWLDKRRARPLRNTVVESKGPPSRQPLSALSMILTGAGLLVFLVIHLLQFRFGPGEADGYVTTLGGEPARDLHRLVVKEFHELPDVIAYVVAMVLLGFHLRHGFWSAFQSLGMLNPRLRPLAYAAGIVVGAVFAFGFLFLPIWIYLFVPEPGVSGLAMMGQP